MEPHRGSGSYRLFIIGVGVMHARKFDEFCMTMYRDLLLDHYRYRQLPTWSKSGWNMFGPAGLRSV